MDMQNMRKIPRALAMPKMDVTMYLPINYKMQATELIGAYREKMMQQMRSENQIKSQLHQLKQREQT